MFINSILIWLATALESIRGPRVIKDVTESRTQVEALVGYSIEGFELAIYCQERSYLCMYESWFVRDRLYKTYLVYASITGVAPQAIMDVCTIERSFPQLLHPRLSSQQQKEAAIGAYLDLLAEKMQ